MERTHWFQYQHRQHTMHLVLINALQQMMSGLYKVTVTNAGGCTASASRNISVSATTIATVTGATSVCGNANVVLTATTVGVSYTWTGPGGFTANTAAINTPAIAGQYKVTVTNAVGCISTATKSVTVTAAPNCQYNWQYQCLFGGQHLPDGIGWQLLYLEWTQ